MGLEPIRPGTCAGALPLSYVRISKERPPGPAGVSYFFGGFLVDSLSSDSMLPSPIARAASMTAPPRRLRPPR